MIGLVTGSGFYDLPDVTHRIESVLSTPYGDVKMTTGTWDQVPVCFIARHGSDHSIPPHAINYRANIWALKDAGAQAVLVTAVSGAINPDIPVGGLVLIDDFLNFTSGRADTFFDGTDGVTHTDMSFPYSPDLQSILRRAAAAESVDLFDGAVYCTTDGPRFETPAEIKMMERLGGDIVGMTGYPEVALANELGLPYAAVGVISNPAAGLNDQPLSLDDIWVIIRSCTDPLHRLMGRSIKLWAQEMA